MRIGDNQEVDQVEGPPEEMVEEIPIEIEEEILLNKEEDREVEVGTEV
jgi:hypothetical protein